ncbi:hypothetical protein CR513_12031, partial [Mucuna pruriens]
ATIAADDDSQSLDIETKLSGDVRRSAVAAGDWWRTNMTQAEQKLYSDTKLHSYNGRQPWEVVKKTKNLKSGEWLKYEQRGQEVQKSTTEEATSANDSNFVPINDNDIYLEVVGGKNEKGNVYGLGKLTNKFMRSTRIPTNLIDMPMVQQMEVICETIHKLNNELVEKKLRRSHLRRKWCNCRTIMRSKCD